MIALDEKVMQDVLEALLSRIGFENGEFQKTLMKYLGDQTFLPQIQKARSENEEGDFDVALMPSNLKNIFVTESSKKCAKFTLDETIEMQKKL